MNELPTKRIIEISNVHRIYETQAGAVPALRGVDLIVEKADFVAIMGPSGSGKTTLMNILGCLDRPTFGRYLLAGTDTATLSDNELADLRATSIGFVFQNFNLLARATVLRNVMLPLVYTTCPRAEREERAVTALRAVGLEERFFEHMSNELSGGQMQRVAIARALVNNPELILADEPTGNLDTATGEMVLKTLEILRDQKRTIVLITHDEEVASHADRVLYIRDGLFVNEKYNIRPASGQPASSSTVSGPTASDPTASGPTASGQPASGPTAPLPVCEV
ncbi:MAG: ABC transporter ATP-binding protein [Coriobacteriia bacterium]|nr:ABC transporter ATP-binding protein [Coriobacteriia bacterium]